MKRLDVPVDKANTRAKAKATHLFLQFSEARVEIASTDDAWCASFFVAPQQYVLILEHQMFPVFLWKLVAVLRCILDTTATEKKM